jgi:hypothetical protein
MEDLPQLDIQEDIATLCESDDEVADEPPLQDLSKPIEASKPDQIFVKPPSNKDPEKEEVVISEKTGKPKRKMSQKQLDHLAKVRAKAVASCKQKKKDRLEIEAKVKKELKAKRAREKLEKTKEKLEEEAQVSPPPRPTAPVPNPDEAFGNFMAHMERFEKMRHEYNLAQQKAKPKPTINPSPPPPPPKPAAPPIQIVSNPSNPYSSAFNW